MSTLNSPPEASPLAADLAIRGTAVLDQGVVPDALVLIASSRILFAGAAAHAPRYDATEETVHDGLLLPGLVDIHCHGGGGVSFPDSTSPQDALVAIEEHRAHGTTGLVASLVTASPSTLEDRVGVLGDLVRAGHLEGIHLEGPFISPARKGAQNPEHITSGSAALVEQLCARAEGTLATMTLAPETDGFADVVEALTRHGVVPSLGHTDADSARMTAGIRTCLDAAERIGARCPLPTATHLFNGMRPIHHRDPGPALAALDAAAGGDLVVELIADGVHLDPRTVRHVFSIAAPENVVLVTDAMAAAGMPDGSYRLGALDVTVTDGVARLAGGDSIAGGTAHLLDVVRHAVLEAGVDLARAVHAASRTPARVLGRSAELGALRAGLRADMVLVDDRLRVQQVLHHGQRVTTI